MEKYLKSKSRLSKMIRSHDFKQISNLSQHFLHFCLRWKSVMCDVCKSKIKESMVLPIALYKYFYYYYCYYFTPQYLVHRDLKMRKITKKDHQSTQSVAGKLHCNAVSRLRILLLLLLLLFQLMSAWRMHQCLTHSKHMWNVATAF